MTRHAVVLDGLRRDMPGPVITPEWPPLQSLHRARS